MPEALTVYRVFMASPSDVPSERRLAQQAQDRVNALYALPRRRLLHLMMWEHLVPSFGRTQDRLNLLVDECDLFVGLLHEKWGTPTGGYTSGFEEEFTRARDRRETTGAPEIAIFFKGLRADDTLPITKDVRQILKFKAAISQDLTYRPVRDPAEWEHELTLVLTNLVLGDFDAAPSTQAAVAAANDSGVRLKASADDAVRSDLALAINSLPERQKIVLTLRYFEELTIDEIGKVLGVSPGTIRQVYDEALGLLGKELMSGDVHAVRRLWEEIRTDR